MSPRRQYRTQTSLAEGLVPEASASKASAFAALSGQRFSAPTAAAIDHLRGQAVRMEPEPGGLPRSAAHLPPPPVRDLRDAILDHLGDRIACKRARLVHVGHLEASVVSDGVMGAHEVEIAAYGLSLR